MSSKDRHGGRGRRTLAVLAVTAAAAAFATPALASSGQGSATIKFSAHAKGRTLSGQGVTVSPEAPATRSEKSVVLPITDVDPGTAAAATLDGSLKFKRGKRSVKLTGLRLDLSAGTLTGRLGKDEIPVFLLGAAPSVNGTGGTIALDNGKLRLTAEAATALKDRLGLERALVRKGVGGIRAAARANPTRAAAKPVVSGSLDWGFLTSWREYIYKSLGPGSVGSITTEGGATTSGEAAKAGSFFDFPAAGGSFERGLYGAGDRLALKTQGSVKFAKPGHCIIEIKLGDLELTIDGANSALVAGGFVYDIDKFNGMACEDKPAVLAPGTTIAKLDVSGVTPSYSADGKTVTWDDVPAALTAAGAVPFGPTYKEGQALDPVTITVGVG